MATMNELESSSLPPGHTVLDYKWMARAHSLARKGEALAHPNPMVGAIVVANDLEVGRGFHTYVGVKHAEVIALEEAGERARGATLYVNLEPCCHTGRTPPCADAIRAAGIARVVAAMADPNPRVAGRGFRLLRNAGIEVVTGVLEPEARRLNEAFARWIRTGRPFVTLKVASTLDGRVAIDGTGAGRKVAGVKTSAAHGVETLQKSAGNEGWITSDTSRAEVQRMRHSSDVVLTGIGTVLADDPLLTDRTGRPRRRPLVRAVLDSRLRLPLRSKLARTAAGDVLVFTKAPENSAKAFALEDCGVELLRIGPAKRAKKRRQAAAGIPMEQVIEALGELDMLSVMIEAGPRVTAAALSAGVVDKVVLFYAPRFEGGAAPPMLPVVNGHGARRRERDSAISVPELKDVTLRQLGQDFSVEGYLRDVYGDH